jgi:tetratricopeptide (TPR) repeat protein
MGNIEAALKDFRSGVRYLEEAEDAHSLATAWSLISMCYEKQQNVDAAIFYTRKSLQLAKATSNQPTLLEAAKRLAALYASTSRLDSAYIYEKLASHTDSTINNTKKTAKIELLKYEEQVRQKGLADQREATAKKKVEAFQKWIIVGLITTLFIALIILGRRKKHPKAIGALSFVVLLLAFEFITFIIHPIVDRITDHKPIYMVPILAIVAAIIGPLHHRFSYWLKQKLGNKEFQHHPEKKTGTIDQPEQPLVDRMEAQHEINVKSNSGKHPQET